MTVRIAGRDIECERDQSKPAGASMVAFDGDGVHIEIRDPSAVDPSKGRHQVMASAQGRLCSLSPDGVPQVRELSQSLCDVFYAGEERPTVNLGQIDVCGDLWMSHPTNPEQADTWVTSVLFADNNQERATSRFATRVGDPAKGLTGTSRAQCDADFDWSIPERRVEHFGSPLKGRTLRMGKCPRLQMYEKDREFKKNVDLPIVRAERWERNGYDGTGRVIRVEFRVTREWLKENPIETRDGRTVCLASIPAEEALLWAPHLFRTLLERTRHTDPRDDGMRPSRRRTSRAWLALREACAEWEESIANAASAESIDALRGAIGRFLCTKRQSNWHTARARFERAIIELQLHAKYQSDLDPTELTLVDVAGALADAVQRKADTAIPIDALERFADRIARRYGYDHAPEWGLTPQLGSNVNVGDPSDPGNGARDGYRRDRESDRPLSPDGIDPADWPSDGRGDAFEQHGLEGVSVAFDVDAIEETKARAEGTRESKARSGSGSSVIERFFDVD